MAKLKKDLSAIYISDANNRSKSSEVVESIIGKEKSKFDLISKKLIIQGQKEHMAGAKRAKSISILNSNVSWGELIEESEELQRITSELNGVMGDEYNHNSIAQLVFAHCEFNDSSDINNRFMSTADLRDVNDAHSTKILNVKLNLLDFLQYITEMTFFVKGIVEKDILSILTAVVAIIRKASVAATMSIDYNNAVCLKYLYEKTRQQANVNEEEFIVDFINYFNNECIDGINNEQIDEKGARDCIKFLDKAHCISIQAGNLIIMEKVKI